MTAPSEHPLYEAGIWQELNDGLRRPGGLGLTEHAADLAGVRTPQVSRLLDVGCGAGITAGYLQSRFGMDLWGVDSSDLLLGEARRRFPRCRFITADAGALPFEDCFFDAVIAECSLSLCPDLSAVLSGIRRVLGAGGRLIITDMYDKGAEEHHPSHPGRSCLQNLRMLSEWRECLEGARFSLLHHEDRSHDLASLAAKIVFEYGSLGEFYSAMGVAGAGCGSRPGYFLIIAQKE